MYTVYILHSPKFNRFYTGSTSDFDTRLDFHRNPEARKFTAKVRDWVRTHPDNNREGSKKPDKDVGLF